MFPNIEEAFKRTPVALYLPALNLIGLDDMEWMCSNHMPWDVFENEWCVTYGIPHAILLKIKIIVACYGRCARRSGEVNRYGGFRMPSS